MKNREYFSSLDICSLRQGPSRDLMLNEFIGKKSSMGMILKNPAEMEKMKR